MVLNPGSTSVVMLAFGASLAPSSFATHLLLRHHTLRTFATHLCYAPLLRTLLRTFAYAPLLRTFATHFCYAPLLRTFATRPNGGRAKPFKGGPAVLARRFTEIAGFVLFIPGCVFGCWRYPEMRIVSVFLTEGKSLRKLRSGDAGVGGAGGADRSSQQRAKSADSMKDRDPD